MKVANAFLYSFTVLPRNNQAVQSPLLFAFRPDIFEVTGFDDPKVTETVENLCKVRGKQCEEAEKEAVELKPAELKPVLGQDSKP